MEQKVDEILRIVKDLQGKVDEMWSANNMDDYKKYPPMYTISKSPIQLTSLAKAVLQNYNGIEKIESQKVELLSEIEKRNFKSPLDVQSYCEKLVLSKFNSDDFLEIKNKIYHNPTFESQPVSVKTMSIIMGLYLRDLYLSKHLELLGEN